MQRREHAATINTTSSPEILSKQLLKHSHVATGLREDCGGNQANGVGLCGAGLDRCQDIRKPLYCMYFRIHVASANAYCHCRLICGENTWAIYACPVQNQLARAAYAHA